MCPIDQCIHAVLLLVTVTIAATRGGDLGGTGGIIPFKKLDGGTEVLLSPPQYLENVLPIYNVKTNKNEKEDETHVTRDRHTSIILFHCLD